ncbi:MAG: hypothetical protein JWM63_3924 [Gammaproteobacteria bacterium]|nr:hypothetical protein [Gammaproteobacteria bacterium]
MCQPPARAACDLYLSTFADRLLARKERFERMWMIIPKMSGVADWRQYGAA